MIRITLSREEIAAALEAAARAKCPEVARHAGALLALGAAECNVVDGTCLVFAGNVPAAPAIDVTPGRELTYEEACALSGRGDVCLQYRGPKECEWYAVTGPASERSRGCLYRIAPSPEGPKSLERACRNCGGFGETRHRKPFSIFWGWVECELCHGTGGVRA